MGRCISYLASAGQLAMLLLFPIRFARAEISFTFLPASDLVPNYVQDPAGSIQVRNINASDEACFALFTNGHSVGMNVVTNEYILPDSGIILGTGQPFASFRVREDTGEAELESLFEPGATIFDPCYLEFEFQCSSPGIEPEAYTIHMDYVFGSEEYLEESGGQNDDAFGAFLNGENMAFAPDGSSPITVNNIHQESSELVMQNEITGRSYVASSFSQFANAGFTSKMSASADTVVPGWNTFKLVIGDEGDADLDSWVLIEAGSFTCRSIEKEAAVVEDIVTSSPTPLPTVKPAPTATVTDGDETGSDSSTGVTQVEKDKWFNIPKSLAVGLVVLFGLFALSLPFICNAFYDKSLAN